MTPPDPRIAKRLLIGLGAVVVIAAVVNIGSGTESRSAGYVAPPVVTAPPTTTRPPKPCQVDPGPYSGQDKCNQTGEVVTVSAVLDSASFTTTDGRTVRLLGVAPLSEKECDRAAPYLRNLIGDKSVMLFTEPGRDKDGKGKLLRYVKYISDPVNTPGKYTADVGYEIVEAGYGRPEGETNWRYQNWLEIGFQLGDAKHAQAKGRAEYDGYQIDDRCVTRTREPEPDYDDPDDVDVPDVDRPNLPDGALTGGFCRRKWYC